MKKHFIWMVCIVSMHLGGLAQVGGIQKIYKRFGDRPLGTAESAYDLVRTMDGGFVLCGVWQDSALVTKVDACGALQWSRRLAYGDHSALQGVCELPNGRLAAAGNCVNCAPGDTARKGLVVLLDAAGNTLADTTLGTLNLDAECKDITTTPGGGCLVAGSAVVASFFLPSDAMVARFDGNLGLDRYRLIGTTFYEQALTVVATADSGFAVGGYTSAYLFAPAHAIVYRLDANCDTLWTQQHAAEHTQLRGMVEDGSGRLVGAGIRMVDTLQHNDVFVWTLDASGQHVTDTHWGGLGNDECEEIVGLDHGYLLACTNSDSSGWGIGIRDWFLYLDANLQPTDSLLEGTFLEHHRPYALVPLSPNGADLAYVTELGGFNGIDFQWVKRHRNGHRATFSEMAMDYQLYPRDHNNLGHVSVSGSALAGTGQYNTMWMQVFRDNVLDTTISLSLSYAGNQAPFTFAVAIPAELHEYHIVVEGHDGLSYAQEAEACEVVAGDAFYITGQSNANAGGPGDPNDTILDAWDFHANRFVRSYGVVAFTDTNYIWHKEAEDDNPFNWGYSGNWGLVLGDHIVQAHQVPVAIVNWGIGGISIDSLLPNPQDHLDPATAYGKFLRASQKAGLQHAFRSILFFQGETNATLSYLDSIPSYRAKFATLHAAWAADFPGRDHDYLFQIRHTAHLGVVARNSLLVAEAQRQIADIHPDLDIMSSTGMNHDGVHYFYDNGYERAGDDIYRLVDRDIYLGSPASNIEPPAIDRAIWPIPNDTIWVELRNLNDALTWYPGFETDFVLEGDTQTTVVSGSVSGNVLTLALSGIPGPGFTGLSYQSHPYGDACPVKNANGIGMLCFYNQPVVIVGRPDPAEMGLSLTVSPVPTTTGLVQLTVDATVPQPLDWELWGLDGRRLDAGQIAAPAMHSTHPILLPAVAGMYLLRVQAENGTPTTLRLVRQ